MAIERFGIEEKVLKTGEPGFRAVIHRKRGIQIGAVREWCRENTPSCVHIPIKGFLKSLPFAVFSLVPELSPRTAEMETRRCYSAVFKDRDDAVKFQENWG